MDLVEKQVLSQTRPRLVEEVVVTESFLCAFCDCNVLDEQMAKLLQGESNYEQRARKLLDVLPSRGPRAFTALMEILEVTNPWLAENMKALRHELRNKDAKINLHRHPCHNDKPSNGFRLSRLTIDPDIHERAEKCVRSHLQQLTQEEQRHTRNWLAEEFQRERRRQEIRVCHSSPRQSQDYHASKECQTDTSSFELLELYEDVMMYLQGSDYVDVAATDFSLEDLHQKVKDLLLRSRKLDSLFLSCIDKFEDSDKYAVSLPLLIKRALRERKEMAHVSQDDKVMLEKVIEERDAAKQQVQKLEDELDKLMKRQVNTQKYYRPPIRHRDSGSNRSPLSGVQNRQRPHNRVESSKTGSTGAQSGNTSTGDSKFVKELPGSGKDDTQFGQNIPSDLREHDNDTTFAHFPNKNSNKRKMKSRTHPTDSSNTSYIDTIDSHGNSPKDQYIHSVNAGNPQAESTQEDPSRGIPNSVFRALSAETQSSLTHMQRGKTSKNERGIARDPKRVGSGKLHRHASEESLKISKSTEDVEIISMSPLNINGTVAGQTQTESTDLSSKAYNDKSIQDLAEGDAVQVNGNNAQRGKTLPSMLNTTTNKLQAPESPRDMGEDTRRQTQHWAKQDVDHVMKGDPGLQAKYNNSATSDKRNLSPAPTRDSGMTSLENANMCEVDLSQQHSGLHLTPEEPQPAPKILNQARLQSNPRSKPAQSQVQLPQREPSNHHQLNCELRKQQPPNNLKIWIPNHYHHYQHQRLTDQTAHHAQLSQQNQKMNSKANAGSHQNMGRSRDPQRKLWRANRDGSTHGYTSDSEVGQRPTARATILHHDADPSRVRFTSPVAGNSKPGAFGFRR